MPHDKLALWRTAVMNMSCGIIVGDIHGQLLEWNDAALQLHGLRDGRGDLREIASNFEIFQPDGTPLGYEHWPMVRVIRGETVRNVEHLVRRSDTGESWFIVYDGARVPAPGGGPDLIVLTLRDVTADRRSQSELRKSLALLQAVTEGTPDAIYVKDREGRYLLFNQAACGFVGLPREAVLGKTDFEFFEPASAELIRSRDLKAMEAGQPVTGEELLTSQDGPQRIYLATKAPYRDHEGNVIGLVGVSRDITEQKRLETELAHAQKMEAIGRLAGGIAHDFNNMLTVINGYAALMLEGLASDHPFHEALTAVQEAGTRSARLTRQLLAFSHQDLAVTRSLELNAVLRDSEAVLRRVLGGVQLFWEMEPELPPVNADPGQLEQILTNLASNSRQAGAFVFRVQTRSTEGMLELTVADDGTGIPEDVRPKIFEPFFTTKSQGTGLGLSVVHGLVKQMGGMVRVESDPGKGTKFTFLLPAVPRETAPVSGLREDATVLVVEDEDAVRRMVAFTLKKHGYTVLVASCGTEALELERTWAKPLHLLLTDVVMPGMSGTQVASLLSARRPGMPVLMMSGYTPESVDADLLCKPFTPAALLDRVRRAIAV